MAILTAVYRIKTKHLLIALSLSLFFPANVYLQPTIQSPVETEVGIPFIQNFSPEEYEFHPQNWAIVQDHRGIMFIANTLGLLEYDGVNWRKHQPLESLTITSLDIDSDGTIYLGGRGNFGYMTPDSLGNFKFTSLANILEKDFKNFSLIWEVAATTHGVYFRSTKYIFRWHKERLTTWPGGFNLIQAIRDTVYVVDKNLGVRRFQGDSLQTVPGGERFANTTMYVILPFDDSSILLGTRTNGLYIFDGRKIEPFRTEANAFLKRARLYHGTKIPGVEPLWALATTDAGLIIIDKSGRIRQIINKKSGLLDDKIHFAFRDNQGALWLSQNNGLSRVEFPSPFSIFDESLGLTGTPHAIARHEGRIYVASNRGLYWLTSGIAAVSPGKPGEQDILSLSEFRPVTDISSETITGISAQIWSLLSVEEDLLVGAAERIYNVRGNDASIIAAIGAPTYSLYQPPDKYDTIFAGLREGLGLLSKTAGKWKFQGMISSIDEEILSIVQDETGTLWLGTASEGVIRVEMSADTLLTADVVHYGTADGIPDGWTSVSVLNHRLVVMTHAGLYRFNPALNFFEPDTLPGGFHLGSDKEINNIVQEKSGRVWMMAGAKKGQIYVSNDNQNSSSFWQRTPFQRLASVNSLMDLMPEEDGNVWFVGRDQKIYRYDSNYPALHPKNFSTSIRQVISLKQDSVLWAGAFPPSQISATLLPALPFQYNSIRFEYAAASYTESKRNKYQFMLEGYDDDWSKWTGETRKDYTGLPAGYYTFRTRGKNIYGEISEEAFLSFSILSPWYQKWWAYLFYILGGIGFIAIIVKTRVRQLQKKTEELESIVSERTAKIAKQTEELKEMDRIKSRFFANISHEFRTPLTLILGPVEDAIQKIKDRVVKTNLETAQRNAGRLQRLIDQLLDLSQLEAGRMKLKVQKSNLTEFMKRAVTLFTSAAEQRNISLNFHADTALEEMVCYFDPDIVEKTIYNLLSNAIKFTSEKGAISVKVNGGETAIVKVKDTGIGIPAKNLPNIFDRFYQNENSDSDFQEGTGIGLALTKELVELHRGKITVKSEESKGTEFTITLPVARHFFEDDEIVADETGIEERKPLVAEPTTHSDISSATTTDSPEDATIILVVEDHAEVRQYIREHLKGDYHILEAVNGKEGLEVATGAIPDLVISDIMMPEMDGTEFCKLLKSDEKISHIPVILLTAKAGDADKVEGLETGADDYLIKPFNVTELKVRVQNLIGQRRKLRERFRREGLLMPRDEKLPSVEEAFLQRLMTIIEEHLSEEEFGIEELSAQLHLGRRQLLRKLQALTGQTPTDFLRTVRLRRAKQMLEQKAGASISEIAFEVGFNNLSYFAKTFKDEFGVLPSELTEKDI